MVRTVIATAAAAVAVGSSLIAIAAYSHQRDNNQQSINQAVCTAVAKLDNAITNTLKRTQKNLPHVAYYQEHPGELATQQQQIVREIRQFRPPPECNQEGVGT